VTARVVTGAAGFIGSAVTRYLAQLPGTLLALDTETPDSDSDTVRMDSAGPQFEDLLDQHMRGTQRAELIHTAAKHPPLATIADTSPDTFAAHLNDLVTAYATVRTFARATERHDIPASAVLLSTVGATRAHRYLPGYDAARAGIESLARAFTLEYSHLSVRTVAVGPVAQSASTAADGPLLPALLALVPRGAYADIGDIAAALAAFAAPCFDAAAGHILTLDGGLSVQLRPASAERPPAGTGGCSP